MSETVSRIAKVLHEKMCAQDIMGYLNAKIDCNELASAIVASQWQPIKNLTPVNGLIVTGYGEYRERDGFSPAFMRWSDVVNGWSVSGMPFYPTHFMPLPSPPSKEGE